MRKILQTNWVENLPVICRIKSFVLQHSTSTSFLCLHIWGPRLRTHSIDAQHLLLTGIRRPARPCKQSGQAATLLACQPDDSSSLRRPSEGCPTSSETRTRSCVTACYYTPAGGYSACGTALQPAVRQETVGATADMLYPCPRHCNENPLYVFLFWE